MTKIKFENKYEEFAFKMEQEMRSKLKSNEIEKKQFDLKEPCKFMFLITISHDFVASNDDELAKQLNAFSASLNGTSGPTDLAKKYGYTTAELEEILNDAAYFNYWNTKHGAGVKYKEQWTQKGVEIKDGKGTSVSAWPVGADVSTPPVNVLPGVKPRFREKAKKAKSQTRIYTEADGIAMHIETSNSPFNPSEGQPDLKVSISNGGHPFIEYIKSKYAGANIYVDRGDGNGSVFLYTCNDPSCSDMTPLPLPGISAAWTYTAIYVFGGEQVGTISKKTTITVLGV